MHCRAPSGSQAGNTAWAFMTVQANSLDIRHRVGQLYLSASGSGVAKENTADGCSSDDHTFYVCCVLLSVVIHNYFHSAQLVGYVQQG